MLFKKYFIKPYSISDQYHPIHAAAYMKLYGENPPKTG
jgi:hypothetical protein